MSERSHEINSQEVTMNGTLEVKFSIPELIRKKRDGETLTNSEISFIVQKIVDESMESCQIGALLMAIYINGMTTQETVCLTKQMAMQGDTLEWPKEWQDLMVDKHSTGGVGDKTSIILAPALAACGLKVPMISGRGLDFTGGTLDKLESMPNLNVNLTVDKMKDCLQSVGCCIVGQTSKLVPADKKMYAMRDVTSTVPSLPLITSSIVSKKTAENLNCLVLDVKFGEAAFCKTKAEAEILAKQLVECSKGAGTKTVAILSSMSEPLGLYSGNAVEIVESIDSLNGLGHPDLINLVTKLGGELLKLADKTASSEEGERKMKEVIENGQALQKFKDMITFQGVDAEFATTLCQRNSDRKKLLNVGPNELVLTNQQNTGYIDKINAMTLAKMLQKYGAGRFKSSDKLKQGVGLELKAHIGEKLEKGAPWITFYHDKEKIPEDDIKKLQSALTLVESLSERREFSRVDQVIQ